MRGMGKEDFNPAKILFQIGLMQVSFYASLALCVISFDYFTEQPLVMDQFFNHKIISTASMLGLTTIVAFAANSVAGAIALSFVVGRARKCLDFTCTVFVIHWITCLLYSGEFPNTSAFWCLNITSLVFMVVLGEYLCMKNEMRDIPLLPR